MPFGAEFHISHPSIDQTGSQFTKPPPDQGPGRESGLAEGILTGLNQWSHRQLITRAELGQNAGQQRATSDIALVRALPSTCQAGSQMSKVCVPGGQVPLRTLVRVFDLQIFTIIDVHTAVLNPS